MPLKTSGVKGGRPPSFFQRRRRCRQIPPLDISIARATVLVKRDRGDKSLTIPIQPKSKLWPLLFDLDIELHDRLQSEGCKHCGSRLDCANYERKPRGGPDLEGDVFQLRLSLCCSSPSCRLRAAPPSTRFLGRRVYLGVAVVLLSSFHQGPSPKRTKALATALGVGRRTIDRWSKWWREDFQQSRPWRRLRGLLLRADEPVPRRFILVFDAESDAKNQSLMMSFLCGPSP